MGEEIKNTVNNESDFNNVVDMHNGGFSEEKILDTMTLIHQQNLSQRTVNHTIKLMRDENFSAEEALEELEAEGMPTKVTVTFDAEWNRALTRAINKSGLNPLCGLIVDDEIVKDTEQEYVKYATKICLIANGHRPPNYEGPNIKILMDEGWRPNPLSSG